MAKAKNAKALATTKNTTTNTTKKGDKDYSLLAIQMIIEFNNNYAEYLRDNGKKYHFWSTDSWIYFRDNAASQRVQLILERMGQCYYEELVPAYLEWKNTHISMRETQFQEEIKKLKAEIAQYKARESQQEADKKAARTAARAAKEETKESE